MSEEDRERAWEYRDRAGYPDGVGYLDEGTDELVDEVTADAVRAVDRPSADAEAEIEVHRRDDEHVYFATIGDLEVADLRYDEVDGRVVVYTTTVAPEFRGRGIATDLIADVLDDVRGRGMRVTVYCRVVAAFMAGNPQFADLIDPEHPGR
ncbi:GNAT family N-acetyltransferase [Agromyces sp. Marseille-P2726]|uniref:GNAT family N-acetyltransferase n=1 Tax=Agromyces sp. Marseille-P2726 TaxID=2709132 RepID=UPI0015702C3B|nr:GNAT family N-acetyltransferase [Agromyces sp. Marseille-P2726]